MCKCAVPSIETDGRFEVILTVHCRYYVEIKCQLDATDDIYCRFYCVLNMFRAILCPPSGAREYHTDGRCLWYLVFRLSVWYGAGGYVSGLQAAAVAAACTFERGIVTPNSDSVFMNLYTL